MCVLIFDESVGTTILFLVNAASPIYAPVVPATLSSLSSDLVFLSFFLLSPFLSRLLLLKLIFFLGQIVTKRMMTSVQNSAGKLNGYLIQKPDVDPS